LLEFLAPLPLPLLVLGIGADHPNDAFAVDDLAFVAHLLNRRPDFHDRSLLSIFIRFAPEALVAAPDHFDNPPSRRIFRGEFHLDLIPYAQPDKIPSHRRRQMSYHLLPAAQFDPVGRAGQDLNHHGSFDCHGRSKPYPTAG
jgi:hypothetical protein